MTVENLRFPVGRLISGNPNAFNDDKDFYTKQPKMNKDGSVKKLCWFDVAFPKEQFMAEVWPKIAAEASTVNPNALTLHPDQYESQRFAFKIINGDSPNCPQGSTVPYNKRDGYPGNYIVKFRSSAFACGVFKFENGSYRRLADNEFKSGDYVVVNANIVAHKEKDGGLYWNPNGVELVGYGKEIVGSGGPDPMSMFGGQTYQLPPGASATPLSSAPVGAQMPSAMPSAPAMPTAPAMPQNMPTAPAMPQAMPAPAYDFIPGQTGFTQPATPAVAQQPSAPQAVGGTAMPVTTFPIR